MRRVWNTMNDKSILRVLSGEKVWPPPIWLMRQAGRYLPEFRELRAQADFMTRCLTPDLATEITLQPIRRYGMDAAILFSDILIVPWALGQSLEFIEGQGPVLAPVRSTAALDALRPEGLLERAAPIAETVRRVRAALADTAPGCTLLGFAGSPFTVACYMVDGGGSREFVETRRLAHAAPALFGRLLAMLVDATIAYLGMQIDAGAEAVVLFDSWSGLLPPPLFDTAVIGATRSIVDALNARYPRVPIIGFPRLAGLMIARYAERTGVDGVGLDTSADLPTAASLLGAQVALQGNLDPLCLVAGGAALRHEAQRIARAVPHNPHIFNLGHGVLPETPPEHVAALVDAVRSA